jgi:predicted ArsR family transcriptional regulator
MVTRPMDVLEAQLLRALAQEGQLTAAELAVRVGAQHWVDLSTALSQLTAKGYVTVVGPLGRATTRYKAHQQGLAALTRTP